MVRLSVSYKGILVYGQGEGQGPLRQAFMYDCNNKSNEYRDKQTVPTWSQNWLLLCNTLSTKPRLKGPTWVFYGCLRDLHWFCMAAVKCHYKLGGLEQHKFVIATAGQKSDMGLFGLKRKSWLHALRRLTGKLLAFSSFQRPPAFPGSRLIPLL